MRKWIGLVLAMATLLSMISANASAEENLIIPMRSGVDPRLYQIAQDYYYWPHFFQNGDVLPIDVANKVEMLQKTGIRSYNKVRAAAELISNDPNVPYRMVIVHLLDSNNTKTLALEMAENVDLQRWGDRENINAGVFGHHGEIIMIVVDEAITNNLEKYVSQKYPDDNITTYVDYVERSTIGMYDPTGSTIYSWKLSDGLLPKTPVSENVSVTKLNTMLTKLSGDIVDTEAEEFDILNGFARRTVLYQSTDFPLNDAATASMNALGGNVSINLVRFKNANVDKVLQNVEQNIQQDLRRKGGNTEVHLCLSPNYILLIECDKMPDETEYNDFIQSIEEAFWSTVNEWKKASKTF